MMTNRVAPSVIVSLVVSIAGGVAEARSWNFYESFITQRGSNASLCLANHGNRVASVPCDHGSDNAPAHRQKWQRWTYTRKQQLKTAAGGQCVQPAKTRVGEKTELSFHRCTNASRQKWELKNGQIKHKDSGLCIKGYGAKPFEDSNVELMKCNRHRSVARWDLYGQKINPVKWKPECKVPGSTRLNEARFVRAHNAYERKHFSRLTDAVDAWRTIEIDLEPKAGSRRVFVSHALPKNKNNCGSGDKGFKRCLKNLRSWSDSYNRKARRKHDLRIVVLNVKKPLNKKQVRWLNETITGTFDEAQLYRPRNRKGSHRNMREALERSHWPRLSALRGQFMFTLNVGPGPVENGFIDTYLNLSGPDVPAFVCPFVTDKDDLVNRKKWKGLSAPNTDRIACVTLKFNRNTKLGNKLNSRTARRRIGQMIVDIWNPYVPTHRYPCFVRGSACQEDPRGFDVLIKSGANLLGTNFPQSKPWAQDGLRGDTSCPTGDSAAAPRSRKTRKAKRTQRTRKTRPAKR